MILFRFLRFWIGGAMKIWFRKIYVHFEEELPKDVPLIFACTHPNSAVDYVFLPFITDQRSFVMVRGDVFENKWLNKIFRSLWMLPVYRMRDGIGTINKNADSFRECFAEFDKNGRTLIFSEGTSVQEKTLQPLKKGTARLALDYIASGEDKEIYIVPMANNYSRFRQFRGTVMTNFATPIKVSEYRKLYEENRPKAYSKLTTDTHAALQKVFIQEKNYSDDSWTERALNVLRFKRLDERTDWIIRDAAPFKEEKAVVDFLNEHGDDALPADWKTRYSQLHVSEELEGALQRSNRKDFHWMLVIFLSFFIGFAKVVHFIPYQLSHWIARNKIKDVLFENTIMTLGSALFYMLQFFIIAIILTSLFGWSGFVAAVSILAISKIYLEIVDDFRFALKNRNLVHKKAEYTRLYNDLMKLVSN